MSVLLSRRDFLATVALTGAALPARGTLTTPPRVMTVTGWVEASQLGPTLPHEHVTTDFLGAEKLPAPRYDRDAAFALIRPAFDALAARGVKTLAECTPAHIGRDVLLLKRLSEATGVRILTNTGYYGAVDNKFLPRHAHTETEEQLAARWLGEWRDGIEGTGIRPGFLKLGVGNGKLPDLHAKLLRAAGRVHRESGLTVAVHTGDGEAARDEVRILGGMGIAPVALIWVHAQNDPGPIQIELARRGAWISLDGYSLATRNPERYRNMLLAHQEAGTLGRVLISHDDGWAVEGEAASGATLKPFGNGNPGPYSSISERLLPDLRAAGFTGDEIRQLTVLNPAQALSVTVRAF
ncbi:MAG: phosphotriesterase [Limisphaerales bacterium]